MSINDNKGNWEFNFFQKKYDPEQEAKLKLAMKFDNGFNPVILHEKNDYAGVMSRVVNGSNNYSIYGNTDSQIVVCGHSHVVSILEATINSKTILAGETKISLCYSTNWASWQLPGGHEYWDLVAKSGRRKNIVIVWQGNQHNADFMFQSEPAFTIAGLEDDPNQRG